MFKLSIICAAALKLYPQFDFLASLILNSFSEKSSLTSTVTCSFVQLLCVVFVKSVVLKLSIICAADLKSLLNLIFSFVSFQIHFAKNQTYLVSTMTCYLVCATFVCRVHEIIRQTFKLLNVWSNIINRSENSC